MWRGTDAESAGSCKCGAIAGRFIGAAARWNRATCLRRFHLPVLPFSGASDRRKKTFAKRLGDFCAAAYFLSATVLAALCN